VDHFRVLWDFFASCRKQKVPAGQFCFLQVSFASCRRVLWAWFLQVGNKYLQEGNRFLQVGNKYLQEGNRYLQEGNR
jgi:hypothetical protein